MPSLPLVPLPKQADFYRDGTPVVCKKMCDRVYKRCGRFSVDGVRMEHAYSSGTEFCEAQGFLVDPTPFREKDIPRGVPVYTKCHIFIDAATSAQPSALVMGALLALCLAVSGSWSTSPDTSTCSSSSSSSSSTTNAATAAVKATAAAAAAKRSSSRPRLPRTMGVAAVAVVLVMAASCVLTTPAFASEAVVTDDTMTSWASSLADELHSMRRQGTAAHHVQAIVDSANYTVDVVDAAERARGVARQLSSFFKSKEELVLELASVASATYAEHKANPVTLESFPNVDVPSTLPDLTYDPHFKTNVSTTTSGIKIAVDEPLPSDAVDADIAWTDLVDRSGVFTHNHGNDSSIRWQYVGTEHGVYRQFPLRRWDTNFIGMPRDYDPRFRPWYLGTLTGPKDIVIVLDGSRSMRGDKWNDAKALAKFLINSLGRNDRYQVVTFDSSHKDYHDNFVYRRTEVLSCKKHELLRGTASNKEDTLTRLENYVPAGGTDPLTGLQVAARLLRGECNGLDRGCPNRDPPRTDCQRFVIFLSDGKDRDHDVR